MAKPPSLNYYQLITQVIEDLEDYPTHPVSLAELSRHYYLSRFHFTRIFQAVTHKTLKAYMDERRLNYAARQLRGSRRRIIDIALEAGYESHEAFTRRFRQVFSLSPSQYRQATDPPPLLPKAKIAVRSLKQIGSSIAADFSLVERPAVRLWGQTWPFYPEESASLNGLHQNVQAFVDQYIAPCGIPRMYGLLSGSEQEEQGTGEALDYFSGYEAGQGQPPEGLRETWLPAARYAVFRYRGEMGDIFDTVFSDVCFTLAAAGLSVLKTGVEYFELYESNYFADGWFKICVAVV